MSTSAYGGDDTENSKYLSEETREHVSHLAWDANAHPDQETQTRFQISRSKPAGNPLARGKRGVAALDSKTVMEKVHRGRKLSLSNAADMSTNTTNVIRGIPIGAMPPKAPSIFATAVQDTSTSEMSVTSIPVGASKRAKLLPQVKSGMYVDTNNAPLLNTSAGALVSNQRQRRRSAAWLRRQNQKVISPLPPRPQSMTTHKTSFDHEGSFDQDLPSIPTIESLTDRPAKPMRTVPLLNITVVPAWIGDDDKEPEQNWPSCDVLFLFAFPWCFCIIEHFVRHIPWKCSSDLDSCRILRQTRSPTAHRNVSESKFIRWWSKLGWSMVRKDEEENRQSTTWIYSRTDDIIDNVFFRGIESALSIVTVRLS